MEGGGGVTEIDYKEILRKYIALVKSCEGVDFLGIGEVPFGESVGPFSAAEWEALEELRVD